ncbi:hypothetical protein JCM33374_g4950 [Metschnikowia sp. JCM 33374]|nr:hypothetical protein JCM33374_g4950 [Metschnikowia sp. JCM 33374]
MFLRPRFISRLGLSHIRRAKHSTSRLQQGSNPQLTFPCLDRLEQKTKDLENAASASDVPSSSCSSDVTSLETGPEPSYARVSSGFEVYKNKNPVFFDNGGYLPEYQIAYETWGTLSPNKDNLILIHTGLSASSHAKSQPKNTKKGWWENFIGSGKYIDTDKYFVVCTNVLGGCYGSTGPSSKDPAINDYYATGFPIVTVNDMVRAQRESLSETFLVSKDYMRS